MFFGNPIIYSVKESKSMEKNTSSRIGVVECFTSGQVDYQTTITSTDGKKEVRGDVKHSEKEAEESAILAARVAGLK